MTPEQLEKQRNYRKARAERLGVSQAKLAGGKNTPESTARHRKMARRRNLEHVLDIKRRTPCADCGHNYPGWCMDFDHLPDHEKRYEITDLVLQCASLATIDAEIAKCELICANCHRSRTARRARWYSNLYDDDEYDRLCIEYFLVDVVPGDPQA
jgi:hypothetical protein